MTTSLAQVIAARLARAGLEADPALVTIQEWNHAQQVAAELDPRRAGHRDRKGHLHTVPLMHLGHRLPERAQ